MRECLLLTQSGHGRLRIAVVQLIPEPIPPGANPCCNEPVAGVLLSLGAAMRRRDFIKAITVSAAWPLAARAQQPAKTVLRVGTVSAVQQSSPQWVAFMRRMAELGYEEGKTFTFDFVQAGNEEEYERGYRILAARELDIILATGPELALKSAIAATRILPIVMIAIDYDPFARGYVTSLARPSGNVTGVFFQQTELTVKRVQLVRDAFPDVSAATMFWDRLSADQW